MVPDATDSCVVVYWYSHRFIRCYRHTVSSPKMGWILLSFDLEIGQILQYAFNIFSSLNPMLYLYLGASFAIFVFVSIYRAVKGS